MAKFFTAAVLSLLISVPAQAQNATSKNILAFGDSLTAGYRLQPGEDFASQLQTVLQEKGLKVSVRNAGVSGDTTEGGLSRIAWALKQEPKPDLVIVALGANDMLRALPVDRTQKNLEGIVKAVTDAKIPVLLAGMKAAPNLGPTYKNGFDKIYTDLADKYESSNVHLYPFFLEGVALKADLNIDDGMHPNPKGVRVMADNIAPAVMDILED